MLNPFEKSSISWLVLLLPGFLSSNVSTYFSPIVDNKNDLAFVSNSLAFSIINLVILVISIKAAEKLFTFNTTQDNKKQINIITPSGLFSLLTISILTGWLWTKIDSNNWLYKTFSPSNKIISRLETFGTTLNRNEKEIKSMTVVTLKNGQQYWGWPYYYTSGADNSNNIVLYLEPAGLLKDGECLLTYTYEKAKQCSSQELKGILIFKDEIRSISFLAPN